MTTEITIVSGLPRSGTSLLMQMLDMGGLEVVTDGIRSADIDNPRGYYEFEPVKKMKQDVSWLPQTRGKAFKMVSQLLYDLPPTEVYRIIFLKRDLAEMLLSQEKMLQRLGRTAAPREEMLRSFTLHLQRLHEWLRQQPNLTTLCVSYNNLMQQPQREAERIRSFLDDHVDVERMVSAVDPALYRNRKAASEWTPSAE